MKKLLTILVSIALLISCSNDDTIIVNQECPTKEISLNTSILLESDKADIFGSKKESSCEFPELYKHDIPNQFNVYFIPTQGGNTIEFNNIEEGRQTFEIPATEYTVVVTNSNKKYRGELPMYSDTLYLFGQNIIDFSKTDEGEVLVTNDYASVMVVNNSSITSKPNLDGQNMVDVGKYYNLYTRKEGNSYLGINNDSKQVNETFKSNQVYRYMICPEGTFTIIVDNDILVGSNDVKL